MGKSNWTEKEIELVKGWINDGLSTRLMGKKLGRSKGSVIGKIHRLDLGDRDVTVSINSKNFSCRPWTKEDIGFLEKCVKGGSKIKDIAVIMDRSYAATAMRIFRLGLTKPRSKKI